MQFETGRFVLRDLEVGDIPALNAIECGENVTRYLPFDAQSVDDTREHIEKSIKQQAETPRRFFDLAIVPRGETHLIGRCGLGVARPEHFEAGIWYVVSPEHWGKGVAVEAFSALLPFAFDELKLHRLFADIDPRNEASARVARKLGMTLEGVFRENYWLKGEWCDAAIYSLLDREWRARTSAGA